MRLSLRMFGLSVVEFEASTDEAEVEDFGVTASTVVGFTASPGGQRWQQSADFGEDE